LSCVSTISQYLSAILTSPIELTKHVNVVSNTYFKYFSAIAPAATQPIVSHADDQPPPDEAFIPYLRR